MGIPLIVNPAAPCFRISFSTWTKQLNRNKGKNLKKIFFLCIGSAKKFVWVLGSYGETQMNFLANPVYSECPVKLLENVL